MNILAVSILLLVILPGGLSILCSICTGSVVLTQKALITMAPVFIARDVVDSVCQRQFDSEQLCKKVSHELTPLAIRNTVKAILKPGKLCKYVCPSDYYHPISIQNQIKSMQDNGQFTQSSLLKSVNYTMINHTIASGSTPTRFLHLTDIHLDLNYTVGSSIHCSLPICCHSQNGFPEVQSSKAGQWGNSRCDLPMKLLDKALEGIDEENSTKIVMITGDYSAHNEWEKTPSTGKTVQSLVEDKIANTLKDAIIVSAPGNNEYLPDHQVPLSPTSLSLTVHNINSDGPPMTVIGINTLMCDNINLYLLSDQTEPLRQLITLQRILKDTPHNNIYLIGHINPTSSSCSNTYGTLFRVLLSKYTYKIKGMLWGHTHVDSFTVNTKIASPQNNLNIQQSESDIQSSTESSITTIGFGLTAGSFSPLGSGVSRYRVYELNKQMQLTNYVDYAFEEKKEKYVPYYSFKEYYGLDRQAAIDGNLMKALQDGIKHDATLRNKYDVKANAGSPVSDKFYCYTYDDQEQQQQCLASGLSFKGKIVDIVERLQGTWGWYKD